MPASARHALVTGASGFIGRLLCQRLLDDGFDIVALLRLPRQGPWHSVLQADLGRTEIAGRDLQGVGTIFHLAGKAHTRPRSMAEASEYETVHVRGTQSLLEAARSAGVQRFVLLSSVKAMGEGGDTVLDETSPCLPRDPYGVTKLAAERLVLESGLPCPVVLRPTLVYGPGGKGNLDLMLRTVRRGLFPPMVFPPNARSMIHVDDVVRACLLAGTHPAACGRTYILTDGQEYATGEIYSWICEALGRHPKTWLPFGAVHVAAALGDLVRRIGLPAPLTRDRLDKLAGSARYSGARICRELGFVPARNLREGIHEMATALERT
jgi:nucleoside-diphosphate-sugar epimerase